MSTASGAAEQFDVLIPNRLMAFACTLLHQVYVQDSDVAAMVRDQTCVLQFACDTRDACPSHPHHLCHEFLRQRQLAADKVVHTHEPFAQPLFNAVESVACCGLLYLPEEKTLVRDEKLEKFWR